MVRSAWTENVDGQLFFSGQIAEKQTVVFSRWKSSGPSLNVERLPHPRPAGERRCRSTSKAIHRAPLWPFPIAIRRVPDTRSEWTESLSDFQLVRVFVGARFPATLMLTCKKAMALPTGDKRAGEFLAGSGSGRITATLCGVPFVKLALAGLAQQPQSAIGQTDIANALVPDQAAKVFLRNTAIFSLSLSYHLRIQCAHKHIILPFGNSSPL